jgi:ATP-binding cassette subfamily B protein
MKCEVWENRKKKALQEDNTTKSFSLSQMLMACKGLPRVLRLVWDASPSLVTSMSIIMLLQGILPLANVIIARLLIDGTLQGIIHGTIQPIVLPVLLQLGVILFIRVCTRFNTTLQVLLNHRSSDHLTLLILRKASTLDLTTFEDAAFYDRLTRARQEAANKPLLMILQLSSMGSSLVTLLSMLALLVQLNWWLTLIALLVPIPSFVADNGYSLSNYSMMLIQSPGKRQQWYLLNLLTTDTYAKEIKLFNLASLFTERYHTLSEQMYQEDRQLQVRHICISLLWSHQPL